MNITNTLTSGKVVAVMAAILVMGCDKTDRSFSLLSDSDSFKQDSSMYAQRKIDILWVVDNSGSMDSSQTNLVNNFQSFVQRFQALGSDYRMAVTTTEAFLGDSAYSNTNQNPDYSVSKAQFKDGCNVNQDADCLGRTGIYIMDPTNTTVDVFKKNLKQGTRGNGDERAFSSFVAALSNQTNLNRGFPRAGAFLQIIILSDEDDFSGTATQYDHSSSQNAQNYVGDHNYNAPSPSLRSVDYYVDWLKNRYGDGNFSVSAIYAMNQSCVNSLGNQGQIIGSRYASIADKTKGVKGSLCSNFGDTLSVVTDNVLELSSVFKLSRVPIESSIAVVVDGVVVAKSLTNGWTYDATTNSVYFHGAAIPSQGASINISFDPVTAKN